MCRGLIWLVYLVSAMAALGSVARFAHGAPLSTFPTWCAAAPDVCTQGSISMLVAKGTSNNLEYMVEIDPTTGAIPVSGTFTGSSASVGATGSAVPASADYAGLNNGGTLIGAVGDSSGRTIVAGAGTAGTPTGGVLSVQGVASGTAIPISAASLPLPTGASTSAKQPALGTAGTASSDVITVQGITSMTALKVDGSGVTQPVSGTVTVNGTVAATQSGTWNITNVSGTVSLPTGASTSALQTTANTSLASIDAGIPAALGQTTMSASMPVTIASDQSALPVTLSAPGPSTGRSSALLFRNSYASTNVTTSAYVQVRAATGGAINRLCVFDSSGSAMKIATGAAASEVDQLYVPPGGSGACYELAIAASTRIAIEALDVNATAGQIIITGLN